MDTVTEILSYWPTLLIVVPLAVLFFGCWFTIHTKQAAVVERFGKFNRITGAGLNFKLPFLESVEWTADLNMQLMDVDVQSKTKDDATIAVRVRVQYFVLPEKVREAFYELDDPEDQIKALVETVILSHIPKIDLDATYQQEDQIAARIKNQLTTVMGKFGYAVENALVTQIVPAAAVVEAMNAINAARRHRVAAEATAEAAKITVIKQAEAECESKALAGQGVARERKAIIDGLREAAKEFEGGVPGIDAHEVMAILMMTQYFDALRDIGANSNTILMPHSPSAVGDLMGQLRTAITTGSLAARKADAA